MILSNETRAPVVVGTRKDFRIILSNNAITMTGVKDLVAVRQIVFQDFLQCIRGPKSARSMVSKIIKTSTTLNCQRRRKKSCVLLISVSTVKK